MHKNRLISAIGSGALTFGGGILTAGCASPLEPVNSVSLHTPRAEVVCIQPGVEEKISCIKKRIATLSSRGDLSMAEAVCENSTSSMMCALKVVRDYIPKVADAHAPWEKCAVPSNEGQSIDIICLKIGRAHV